MCFKALLLDQFGPKLRTSSAPVIRFLFDKCPQFLLIFHFHINIDFIASSWNPFGSCFTHQIAAISWFHYCERLSDRTWTHLVNTVPIIITVCVWSKKGSSEVIWKIDSNLSGEPDGFYQVFFPDVKPGVRFAPELYCSLLLSLMGQVFLVQPLRLLRGSTESQSLQDLVLLLCFPGWYEALVISEPVPIRQQRSTNFSANDKAAAGLCLIRPASLPPVQEQLRPNLASLAKM